MDFDFEDDIFQANKRSDLLISLDNQYKAKIVEPRVFILELFLAFYLDFNFLYVLKRVF